MIIIIQTLSCSTQSWILWITGLSSTLLPHFNVSILLHGNDFKKFFTLPKNPLLKQKIEIKVQKIGHLFFLSLFNKRFIYMKENKTPPYFERKCVQNFEETFFKMCVNTSLVFRNVLLEKCQGTLKMSGNLKSHWKLFKVWAIKSSSYQDFIKKG